MTKEEEWNNYIKAARQELDAADKMVNDLLKECRQLKKENKKLIKNGKINK